MKPPEIKVGKTTIGNIVDILSDQFGDKTAVEYKSLDLKLDFSSFKAVCDGVAKGLMALGVEKGEKIAIWANNLPEWVYTQYGSARMGAVLVTVNTGYKSAELEYLHIINKICPALKKSEPGTFESRKLPFLQRTDIIL